MSTEETGARRSSHFGGCLDAATLAAEERIVWLAEPARYPYLRETMVQQRAGRRPTLPGRTVVAYAVLRRQSRDQGGGARPQRVWYVTPGVDPYAEHGHVGWPIEAVWPQSIRAGALSEGPTDAEHQAAHAGAAQEGRS